MTVSARRGWLHPNPRLEVVPEREECRDVDVTMDDDGEWAWKSTAAFGWGVGHPAVAVLDRTLERAESGDEAWAMNVLTHVVFADPWAGIALLDRLRRSPDVVEDLVFGRSIKPAFERDSPDVPQYGDPAAELDDAVELSDEQTDRLLAVIGASINADRLRRFDDSYRIDLDRATDEYGSTDEP